MKKDDSYWKDKLTEEQYRVLREKGTERPFTGEYTYKFEDGNYYCAACNAELFSSENKYDAHCGWPSFDTESKSENIVLKEDLSNGMVRTEVLCKNCGGHLGHVFDDPRVETTGKWFCINSTSLDFKKK